uniref:Uncharacterized protein n=1 Tax=Setaria italica TaxID=4555 RepID=K4ANW2_SETIT
MAMARRIEESRCLNSEAKPRLQMSLHRRLGQQCASTLTYFSQKGIFTRM